MTRGGRNLLILGFASMAFAIVTTAVSLVIYHNSGDIYIDRSRPGFLPDETEIESDATSATDYEFSENGVVTKKALDEYLDNLKNETDAIQKFNAPFSADSLSDEKFGL